MAKYTSIGGQALIEGIMMRGPKGNAMSLRLPDGTIETELEENSPNCKIFFNLEYKKVITNRREKSDKPQGAQKGHKPHSLNNKLEKFINYF